MKTLNLTGIGRVVLMLVFALIFTQCEKTSFTDTADTSTTSIDARGGQFGTQDMCACLASLPAEDLSDAEIDALIFMREEEKLARDVYLHLATVWNAQVFSNIARSEQRHMDAVLCLLDKYALTDPVGTNSNGVFVNGTLQELYNTLVAEGAAGLEEAFTAGATIEDLDIYDLAGILADPDVDNADVRAVFNNLMRGSRNHLRAFARNLEQLGASYTPQYLTPEEYAAILSTDRETGNGPCSVAPGGNSGNQYGPNGMHYGRGFDRDRPNGPGNGTGICPRDSMPGTGVPPGNSGGQGNGNRKRGG